MVRPDLCAKIFGGMERTPLLVVNMNVKVPLGTDAHFVFHLLFTRLVMETFLHKKMAYIATLQCRLPTQ